MSIKRAICNEVYESAHDWPSISPSDIQTVEFRQGCAEIEVTYWTTREPPSTDVVTINAAPVLTHLLTWAMNAEVTHED